jgi:hypothetical protein
MPINENLWLGLYGIRVLPPCGSDGGSPPLESASETCPHEPASDWRKHLLAQDHLEIPGPCHGEQE